MPTNNVNAHLDKAKSYIEKGDSYYRQAAAEIVAAKHGDPSLSNVAIGERIERSEFFVRQMLKVADGSIGAIEPFGGREEPGSREDRAAKQALRDPEKRKKVLAELDLKDAEKVMGDALDVVQQKSPSPDRRRKREQREFADEAHNHTELAWDHLRARTSLFADVPVSERETQQLEWCRMVVEQLLGDEMDDELREVLENA